MGSEQGKKIGATGRTECWDIPPENLYSPRSDPSHEEHDEWKRRTDPTTPQMIALCDSMRLNGTDEGEPVIYSRTRGTERNEIADGDRRHAAALLVNAERKAAKPKGTPLTLRAVATQDPLLARQMGNACRQDDPPMILARRYRAALASMGKPAAAAANGLTLAMANALLECLTLPADVQARVNARELPADVAARMAKAGAATAREAVAKSTGADGKIDAGKAKSAAREATGTRRYPVRYPVANAMATRFDALAMAGQSALPSRDVAALLRYVLGDREQANGRPWLVALASEAEAAAKALVKS